MAIPIEQTEWEKLNDFQYRHKKFKDSYLELRDGIFVYYDKSNLDVIIPIQAIIKNPAVDMNPQSLSLENILGTYNDFKNVFENGLL